MSIDPLELAKKKTQLQETQKKAESAKNALETAGKAGSVDWQRNVNVSDLANKQLQNLNVGGISASDVTKIKDLKDLPIQPDPELLKKEAMAKAQTIRAEAEIMLQQKKEEEINKLKDKAEKLIPPALVTAAGLFLALPIKDPKVLATLAYQKAKTKIKEAKQKASKENLKKSKEAYTFPMKPPVKLELGELPKLPQLPKIPEIPKKSAIDTPKKNTCDDYRKIVKDIETKLAAEKVKKEQNKKEGIALEEKGLKGTPAWNAAAIGYLSAERQIKSYEGLLRNAQQLLKGC